MKVLVLARNYPNKVQPQMGLWTEGFVRAISKFCETRVIAPVPYCPPLPRQISYTLFRGIPPREFIHGIEVKHPRFVVGPGSSLHSYEAKFYEWGIRRQVQALHREFPFDLIHAHFSYPDGVVAAKLGQRYRVPLFITEQSPWLPWMQKYPRVQRQAVWASQQSAYHLALSRYGRDTIAHFTGESAHLRIMPNGVDGSVFTPLADGRAGNPNQIVYVGFPRFVKGVDVLLKAMQQLIDGHPQLRLVLVGGGFYRYMQRETEQMRTLARELGLAEQVEFVGDQPPARVAEFMRQSSLLVLPSRAESFGAVLIEALACGIPVVATRCGGPEDIVNDEVGVLVAKEDPAALASGIESVLARRSSYDAHRLRTFALENFAWEQIARRTLNFYYEALDRGNVSKSYDTQGLRKNLETKESRDKHLHSSSR